MANPNIVNVATIYGNLNVAALTTATSNVVTNAAASNTVIKLNTVSLANYGAANIVANVMINRSSTLYYLAGSVVVPANSTLVVTGKDNGIYMLEGDVLQANVSANTTVSILTSFETIS